MTDEPLLTRFVAGQLQPTGFDHRAHLRVAFALLRERPFLEACIAMRDGLRRLASQAGHPTLYHETVTVASMSLIGERLGGAHEVGRFDDWIALHPALLDRHLLRRYYHDETLAAPATRERFLLPDRVAPRPTP